MIYLLWVLSYFLFATLLYNRINSFQELQSDSVRKKEIYSLIQFTINEEERNADNRIKIIDFSKYNWQMKDHRIKIRYINTIKIWKKFEI